jgi:hypothetical protein
MNNYALGSTIHRKFSTAVGGAGTTLSGSPVIAAYPADSTTQITAGITLTVDFDSLTGLNHVAIVASSGNGFAADTDYALVVTQGTVGGVNVAGTVVAEFGIENGNIPTATENADALLDRDMSAVAESNARSPLNALRFLRNKWSLAGATLTVKKEDDTATAWTAEVSTSAGADPISGSDPA